MKLEFSLHFSKNPQI